MRKTTPAILAILLVMLLALPGCQPQSPAEPASAELISYEGFNDIPDLGALAGAESDTDLANAAAERMRIDPETVFVYSLRDVSEEELTVWTDALAEQKYEASADLEQDGSTVTWYSADRKNGLVAGYMDTDHEDGPDAFAVFLVSKSLRGDYVDLDFDSDAVQRGWGNANDGASLFIDDKKIYGYGYINSEDGFLSKNTDSSGALLLVENVRPRYVHEWDKTVYAVLPGRLVAVDTKEKDPEAAVSTLMEKNLTSLQIFHEGLYYTTKDGLYTCDFDGENTRKVLSKKMKDAYLVGDKVFYRDPADENTEHACSLLTGADVRLTEEAVTGFFLGSKNYAYYVAEALPEEETETAAEDAEETAEDENASAEDTEEASEDTGEAEPEEEEGPRYVLVRLNLKDGERTELASVRKGAGILGIEDRVYYVSDEHEGQIYSISKKGGNPRRVTRDKDCTHLMTFHDMILYYDYDDKTEEGLEHIYISTTDGFMKSDILR